MKLFIVTDANQETVHVNLVLTLFYVKLYVKLSNINTSWRHCCGGRHYSEPPPSRRKTRTFITTPHFACKSWTASAMLRNFHDRGTHVLTGRVTNWTQLLIRLTTTDTIDQEKNQHTRLKHATRQDYRHNCRITTEFRPQQGCDPTLQKPEEILKRPKASTQNGDGLSNTGNQTGQTEADQATTHGHHHQPSST